MAMGNSEYAGAIGAPFAITVIGGLSFSALLTLILIPTVCMGLENTLQWYKELSAKVWVLHGLLFMAGAGCIWFYGGGLLWQSVYGVLLLAGIPGVTYFMQTSLRRARSKVIDPGDGHPYIRPQPGEDIRLAGTCQPPVEEWPADPSTVRFEEKLPYTCRIAG